MTRRGADYQRKAGDDYPTPAYVTEDLLRWLHNELNIYLCDPCPGPKQAMIKVFKQRGYCVVYGPKDFITGEFPDQAECDFVTNPPYGNKRGSLAVQFVERALDVTKPWQGKVVMLLPFDFDAAKTRRHLFDRKEFAAKIVLPYRVAWFNGKSGSTIHAWFCWSHRHKGPSVIKYMRLRTRPGQPGRRDTRPDLTPAE
jgi:hypothetical protein